MSLFGKSSLAMALDIWLFLYIGGPCSGYAHNKSSTWIPGNSVSRPILRGSGAKYKGNMGVLSGFARSTSGAF